MSTHFRNSDLDGEGHSHLKMKLLKEIFSELNKTFDIFNIIIAIELFIIEQIL